MASSGVPQRSRQSVARRASEGKRAGVVPWRRNQSRVPRASRQPGGRRPVSDEGHRAVFPPLRGPSRTVDRARGDSLVSRLAERPRAIDSSARWSLAGMAASVSRASRSSVADRSPEDPVVPPRVVPGPADRAGRFSWVGLLTGKSDCRRSHAERVTLHAAERAGHEGQCSTSPPAGAVCPGRPRSGFRHQPDRGRHSAMGRSSSWCGRGHTTGGWAVPSTAGAERTAGSRVPSPVGELARPPPGAGQRIAGAADTRSKSVPPAAPGRGQAVPDPPAWRAGRPTPKGAVVPRPSLPGRSAANARG